MKRLRHFLTVTAVAANLLAIYSFPTFRFLRDYSLQQSPMILRVSELQTGWVFVAPIAIGRYRDFEVLENRRYLSKPEIVVDFVLPIPPCSARPLSVLTHEITMYYTSIYEFNLLLT